MVQKKVIVKEKITYKKPDGSVESEEKPITLENMFNMKLLRDSYKKVLNSVDNKIKICKINTKEQENKLIQQRESKILEIENLKQSKEQLVTEKDELTSKLPSLLKPRGTQHQQHSSMTP